MTNCVYRDEDAGCVRQGGEGERPPCQMCEHFLSLDTKDFSLKYRDPLWVTTRRGEPTTGLRDMLAKKAAFLVCGGPSANDLPLTMLNHRGVFSLAVNNMAAHPRFRPQAFVGADPPSKFSFTIWDDPAIMKFIPTPKLHGGRSKLRRKANGVFHVCRRKTRDCPNVWAFKRDCWMLPDASFFLGDGAKWGNLNAGVKKTGMPKTVCTMLLGLRILYYLGARKVYLIGADFRMRSEEGYAFPQQRTKADARSNNHQFQVINDLLVKMSLGVVFSHFGLEVFNCFERSGLRAFPYVPFAEAFKDAKGDAEDSPDLAGWYEKPKD